MRCNKVETGFETYSQMQEHRGNVSELQDGEGSEEGKKYADYRKAETNAAGGRRINPSTAFLTAADLFALLESLWVEERDEDF